MSSDATAVLTRKQPAGKSKGRTKSVVIWSIVGGIFVLGMLSFVLWIVGITHGREFDANSWAFRSFTFVRNPLTGNQFTSIHRSSDFPVPAAISALTKGGPLAPGTRWDLVELYKGPSYCVGEAQVLLDYLSALDQQNNYFWDAWTTSHPKAAPILWSAVRDCVHLRRYDRLPELFEAARTTADPGELKPILTQIMLEIADDEAQLQTELGDESAKKRALLLADAYRNPPPEDAEPEKPDIKAPKAEVEQIP